MAKSHRCLCGLCLPLVATFCIFVVTKIQRSVKPIKIEGGGKVKGWGWDDAMGSWSSEETGAPWGNQCGRSIFVLRKKKKFPTFNLCTLAWKIKVKSQRAIMKITEILKGIIQRVDSAVCLLFIRGKCIRYGMQSSLTPVPSLND